MRSSIIIQNLNLNNSYIHVEEEIIGMLDGGSDVVDNELIEEVDYERIGDMMVDRVSFKDVVSA